MNVVVEAVTNYWLTGLTAITAVALVRKAVLVVPDGNVVNVERLGKSMDQPLGPGMHLLIPLLDTPRVYHWTFDEEKMNHETGHYECTPRSIIKYAVPTSEQMLDISDVNVLSSERMKVVVNSVLRYRITDAKKAVYEVDNLTRALESRLETVIREVVKSKSVNDLLVGAETVAIEATEALREDLEARWGIQIVSFEVQNIAIDAKHAKAFEDIEMRRITATRMRNQIEAERETKLSEQQAKREIESATFETKRILEEARLHSEHSVTMAKLASKREYTKKEHDRAREQELSRIALERETTIAAQDLEDALEEKRALLAKRKLEAENERIRMASEALMDKLSLEAERQAAIETTQSTAAIDNECYATEQRLAATSKRVRRETDDRAYAEEQLVAQDHKRRRMETDALDAAERLEHERSIARQEAEAAHAARMAEVAGLEVSARISGGLTPEYFVQELYTKNVGALLTGGKQSTIIAPANVSEFLCASTMYDKLNPFARTKTALEG